MERRNFLGFMVSLGASGLVKMGTATSFAAEPNPSLDDYRSFMPGETKSLKTRPSQIVSLNRILIPSNVGENFNIMDVKMDKISQLSHATIGSGIPGIVFSKTSFGVRLMLEVAKDEVEFVIKNISKEKKEFRAALLGHIVEGESAGREIVVGI